VASRQELSASVEALDHKLRFALAPQAPHHRDPLTRQRVMRRRHPNALEVTGIALLSLMAG